jgi:ABC-type sugar transport system ATPase subunit
MLQIKNLYKNFRGLCALNNVSLDLASGVVVAIVGDNGAGKSTLMKCVSGAIRADSGEVIFNNQKLSLGSPQISRAAGIEMIYQDLSLCRLQDVVTNIFLGREEKIGFFLNRKLMSERCKAVMAELGADFSLKKTVGELSGGQQQSVAIARAMISDPKLLIMDEPTAALAAREVANVLNQITALKKRGVSVAIITHRLSDVFEVADRILVMRHGEIKHDLALEETSLKDLTSKIVAE